MCNVFILFGHYNASLAQNEKFKERRKQRENNDTIIGEHTELQILKVRKTSTKEI
jgi:hypothetical protein